MSDKKITTFPRAVRVLSGPLALYLRPGHNDHRAIEHHIASGGTNFSGAIFDPSKLKHHHDLYELILKHNLDAILDPKTIQSATIGGHTEKLAQLPWGKERPHNIEDFSGVSGRRIINALAEFVIQHGFTQIIAPTHIINNPDSPWFNLDIKNTQILRNQLDKIGGAKVQIIYKLTISKKSYENSEERLRIVNALYGLPISSLWLTIDNFGRNSTATAARNYVDAAHDFHSLNVPIVADYVGGVIGLFLLSFGAVGGIAHGVTLHERFSANSISRPRKPGNFGRTRSIYIPTIDSMLHPEQARLLINRSTRTKAYFSCNDSSCCPRGFRDTVQDPAHHFLYQRMKEITKLSRIPETIRPQSFLDNHLRDTTDKALHAANIDWNDEKFEKKLQENRKRLDRLRTCFGDYAQQKPPLTFSLYPKTRAARN